MSALPSLRKRLVSKLTTATESADKKDSVTSARSLVEALRDLKSSTDTNTFKLIYLHILSLLRIFANTDRKVLKTKIRVYLRRQDKILRDIFEETRREGS